MPNKYAIQVISNWKWLHSIFLEFFIYFYFGILLSNKRSDNSTNGPYLFNQKTLD